MNYLAHLFLSSDSEDSMIGNFLADQLTLKETKAYSGGVSRGIHLHRSIDSYTDNHPSVREINTLFRPTQRKYAPVVTDIVSDYLLHESWSKYSEKSFETFCNRVYKTLIDHLSLVPDRLHNRVNGMVRARWLSVYTHLPGLNDTFWRVGRRAKFENNLHEATKDLTTLKPVLIEKFNEFFPDVIEFVRAQKNISQPD